MNCIIVLIILLVIIIISNLSLFNNYNIVEKYVSDYSTDIINDINSNYRKLDKLNNKDLSEDIKAKVSELETKSSYIEQKIKCENNDGEEILNTLNYIDGYNKPTIQNMYCTEHDIGERHDTLHGCAKHCSENDNCYSFSYSNDEQKCNLSSNCYAPNSEGNNLSDTETKNLKRQTNAVHKPGHLLYIKDPDIFPMKNYNVQIGKKCNDKFFNFKSHNQIKKIIYHKNSEGEGTNNCDPITDKGGDCHNIKCDPITGKGGDCYIKNCAQECQDNSECISFQYDLDNNECILNKNCYKNSGNQCIIDTNQYDCGNGSTTDPENNREIDNYEKYKITYDNNTFISDKLKYINNNLDNLSKDDKLNAIQSECESICELDNNCTGFDYIDTGKDKCRFSSDSTLSFNKTKNNRKYCSKPKNEKNINLYSRIILDDTQEEPDNIKCNICEADAITDKVFLKLYRNENDGKPLFIYINDRNNITDVRSIYSSSSNFEKFEKSDNTCLQLFSEINYKGYCKIIEADNNIFRLSDLEDSIKNFNSFKMLNGSCSSNDINDCNTS